MKKADSVSGEELRPEYRRKDLEKGVRGKYYDDYIKGTNPVACAAEKAEQEQQGQ
jgi:hypothetical protein